MTWVNLSLDLFHECLDFSEVDQRLVIGQVCPTWQEQIKSYNRWPVVNMLIGKGGVGSPLACYFQFQDSLISYSHLPIVTRTLNIEITSCLTIPFARLEQACKSFPLLTKLKQVFIRLKHPQYPIVITDDYHVGVFHILKKLDLHCLSLTGLFVDLSLFSDIKWRKIKSLLFRLTELSVTGINSNKDQARHYFSLFKYVSLKLTHLSLELEGSKDLFSLISQFCPNLIFLHLCGQYPSEPKSNFLVPPSKNKINVSDLTYESSLPTTVWNDLSKLTSLQTFRLVDKGAKSWLNFLTYIPALSCSLRTLEFSCWYNYQNLFNLESCLTKNSSITTIIWNIVAPWDMLEDEIKIFTALTQSICQSPEHVVFMQKHPCLDTYLEDHFFDRHLHVETLRLVTIGFKHDKIYTNPKML